MGVGDALAGGGRLNCRDFFLGSSASISDTWICADNTPMQSGDAQHLLVRKPTC
jgi:hypothetical protein